MISISICILGMLQWRKAEKKLEAHKKALERHHFADQDEKPAHEVIISPWCPFIHPNAILPTSRK